MNNGTRKSIHALLLFAILSEGIGLFASPSQRLETSHPTRSKLASTTVIQFSPSLDKATNDPDSRLASCAACQAATAFGTCILADPADCGTTIFYREPQFSYGIDGTGCIQLTVTCTGADWAYGSTILSAGGTAMSPSGDHYANGTITFNDTYTCNADGTFNPSNGSFACETSSMIVLLNSTTTLGTTVTTTTPLTTVTIVTTATTSNLAINASTLPPQSNATTTVVLSTQSVTDEPLTPDPNIRHTFNMSIAILTMVAVLMLFCMLKCCFKCFVVRRMKSSWHETVMSFGIPYSGEM